MMKHKLLSSKSCAAGRILLALLWLSWLQASNAYDIPYSIIGLASILCITSQQEAMICPAPSGWEKFWIGLGSALFSFAVMLANYNIAYYPDFGSSLVNNLFLLIYYAAGVSVAWSLFAFLLQKAFACRQRFSYSVTPWIIFCASMGIIAAVYLLVLFMEYRPGILTADSVVQLSQIQSGVYSNHHPYYHTQLIRLIMAIGTKMFGDANSAMTLYSVFQILSMAAIFAYVLVTMYQKRVPMGWIMLCLAWFTFVPYHIIYSFTMWKDVLHGGMTVLFLTALYRIFSGIGRYHFLNYGLLAISGLGFCLYRSNGFIAFLLFVLLFFLFLSRKYPKLSLLFLVILAASWVLKNPALDALEVSPPDTIESLSIPAQQIARTVAHGGDISEEQLALLQTVIDVEKIPEAYREEISDPIKNLVRDTGNQQAITDQADDFIRLWVELGLQNPGLYVEAWVEQTKGYWNSGYDYWIWSTNKIHGNGFGIYVTAQAPAIVGILWSLYTRLFSHPLFCLVISIGFHVWLIAGAVILAAAKKKPEVALLGLFLLAIVASLMVATPVFSEFRYAYSVIASVPVILMALMMPLHPEAPPAM